MPHTADQLAERYGRTPRLGHRLAFAVLVALAVAAAGFIVWIGIDQSRPDVQSALVSYTDVSDSSVTVRFEVIKGQDATVLCRVRAQNANHATVGSQDVRVGPPRYGSRSVVEAVIPTSERPVNGELQECRAT